MAAMQVPTIVAAGKAYVGFGSQVAIKQPRMDFNA